MSESFIRPEYRIRKGSSPFRIRYFSQAFSEKWGQGAWEEGTMLKHARYFSLRAAMDDAHRLWFAGWSVTILQGDQVVDETFSRQARREA